jgi:pilus assembly protein CpaF
VQLQRFSDGRRRVVSLQEITGMEGEVIAMQEIFRFDRRGVDANEQVIGRHVPTGIRPRFSQRAKEFGFSMPESLFADAGLLVK